MSNPIFVRREKADAPGEYEFVEVSADTVDPEAIRSLVVAHPAYREVVAESIQRKEKIRELSATKSPANDPAPGSSQSAGSPPVAQPIDEEALLNKLIAKQQALAEEQARAQAERLAQIDAVIAEFKLPTSSRDILVEAADPRRMAQTLAKNRYTFQEAPAGGNPGSSKDLSEADAIQARIFAKLGL